ncbi:hypothetical protein KAR91_44960 [Candidatus Pacearchaeota archaeon]|nr:hypothetical protein [Candidatus Pacearchaeota archaeon]
MNTEIVEAEKEGMPFPKLMKSKQTGSIFLMTNISIGTKIASGPNDSIFDAVGKCSKDWTVAMEDFTGSITLSN